MQVPDGHREVLRVVKVVRGRLTRLKRPHHLLDLIFRLVPVHHVLLSNKKPRRTEISIRLGKILLWTRVYLAVWFARTVSRDLYRAAAFLCMTPFCTDLSITEITSGRTLCTSSLLPESSVARSFLIYVLTLDLWLRLITRRFSFCRTRFSADL